MPQEKVHIGNDLSSSSPEQKGKHNAGRSDTDTAVETSIQDDSKDVLAAVPDVEVDLEIGEGTELKRKPPTIVPRMKRRGLFAQLVIGIPEIDDPVQYSAKIKNSIVFIIAIAAIAAPMGYW